MDPITIAALATSAVNVLRPFFGSAAESAAKKAGEDVYTTIKGHLVATKASTEPLAELASNPNDPDLQAALRVLIGKLIAADEHFATTLSKLIDTQNSSRAETISMRAGDNSTQIGRVEGDANFGTSWNKRD